MLRFQSGLRHPWAVKGWNTTVTTKEANDVYKQNAKKTQRGLQVKNSNSMNGLGVGVVHGIYYILGGFNDSTWTTACCWGKLLHRL